MIQHGTRSRRILRAATVVVTALAAGVILSVLKGSDGGTRLVVGNLSAPWLLIPLLAGAAYPARARHGAFMGVLATTAALVGFYAQQSPLSGAPRPAIAFLEHPRLVYDFIVQAHLIYFAAGVLTAALLGVVGARGVRRGSPAMIAVLASLLLICEPFAWLLSPVATSGVLNDPWGVWSGEIVAGALTALFAARQHRTACLYRR